MNKQIKRDTEMLASHGIMDYSMLLGIENQYRIADEAGKETNESGRRASNRSKLPAQELLILQRHMFKSPDSTQIFHISIIDFL